MITATQLHTSEIPLNSSIHGQLRRTQRNIAKRDLQAAVKYGIQEKGFPCPKTGLGRWKYTHADIVYITDYTSTHEVTSWVLSLPLEKVNITERMQQQYDAAKKRIRSNPGIITSHTVLVVDKSASMRTADVDGHRSRARGAYYALAEEYVATMLPPIERNICFGDSQIRYTDVVTLIEMRDTATVVFHHEPMSWVLFNRFVDLAEDMESSRGHGNYTDALAAAIHLLKQDTHDQLALSLFFLTDGKPSDHATTFKHDRHHLFPDNLMKMIEDVAFDFRGRFTFQACGLGTDNFDILKAMVEVAKSSGAVGRFGHGGRDLIGLCDSLTSVMSSTTGITSQLSTLNIKKEERVKSAVEKEDYSGSASFLFSEWTFFSRTDIKTKIDRLELFYDKDRKPDWRTVALQSPDATGFAVKRKIFGEGAERIVYEMMEINSFGQPVGVPLVAKDSKYVIDNPKARQPFHKTFIRTQMKSACLAEKFNQKLDQKGISRLIPRIRFLPCSVYDCNTAESMYLAEKRLAVERYKKWNDNAGGVDGVKQFNASVAPLLEGTPRLSMMQASPGAAFRRGEGAGGALIALQEEDEEDDYYGSEDGDVEAARAANGTDIAVNPLEAEILESDIPQAFTHWTYTYTKRELMVCDLQGELAMSGSDPIFELTDPCIHSDCRGRDFGRTDKGRKGMHQFFRTHHCSPVCELLGIHGRR